MITLTRSRRHVEVSSDDGVYAVPRMLGASLVHRRNVQAGRNYVETGHVGGVPLIRVAESRVPDPFAVVNRAEFRSDALRTLIMQYYEQEAHDPPPGFFRGNRAFNAALGGYLLQAHAGASCPLRVKEVGAGSYRYRWGKRLTLNEASKISLDVTVTDYALGRLGPRHITKNITLRTATENLYAPVQELSNDERFQVILGTYLIDSLSFAGDKILRKVNGAWYEVLMRPLEPESFNDDGRERQRLGYEWITVGTTLASEDEAVLNKCFSEQTTHFVHFPKGTVKFLIEMAQRQLTKGGTLLFGDLGALTTRHSSSFPISFTNGGTPFIQMQMPLLVALAKAQGLVTELQSIDQFIARYADGSESSRFDEQVLAEAKINHGVMLFRLPQEARSF